MPQPPDPSPPKDRPPTPAEMVRLPVVYRLAGMDDAQVRADIIYREADGGDLKMDVYRPAAGDPAVARPAVLFIHGGPIPAPPVLQPKGWRIYRDYGKLAAAAGWVGVVFNHRYHGIEKIETAQADIEAAVEAVRGRSAELGVNKHRLALWVFSGGGSFLASVLRRPPSYVRALVAFYAIMDLRPYRAMAPASGGDELLARFSPLAALDDASEGIPPLFIARAGLDNPLLNNGTDAFLAAALKKNLPLALRNHPAGHHGFDILDDEPISREIIGEALSFLKTQFMA